MAGETTDARLPNTASQQAQLQAKDDEIARLNQIITELQKQLTITQNAGVNDELQTKLATAHSTIAELQSVQGDELKGIHKFNHDTERTKRFAQIIAKSIWDMDKTEAIRTKDMVQFLKPLIAQFEPSKLPDNDETISAWLADVKPPHATKGGRPPKDELLEIPLTFKK